MQLRRESGVWFRDVEQAEAMIDDVYADDPVLGDALVIAEIELELCAN